MIYPESTPRGNNALGMFRQAAGRHGIRLEIFFYGRAGLCPELERAGIPDIVFMRGYNFRISEYYENLGATVINTTASMRLSRDKYLTSLALEKHGIPAPRTSAFQPPPGFEKAAGMFRTPFILKQRFGSKGENVYLIHSAAEYDDALGKCAAERLRRLGQADTVTEFGETAGEIECGASVLLQEYVSSSEGKDIRVWTAGGKVIGHILRYNTSSFKSNFAAGGSFREIPLPPEAAEIAVSAANATGLFFAGVDLLFDGNGGFKVCEVNGNAGFRTAPTDIPDAVFGNLTRERDFFISCGYIH